MTLQSNSRAAWCTAARDLRQDSDVRSRCDDACLGMAASMWRPFLRSAAPRGAASASERDASDSPADWAARAGRRAPCASSARDRHLKETLTEIMANATGPRRLSSTKTRPRDFFMSDASPRNTTLDEVPGRSDEREWQEGEKPDKKER